MGEAERPRLARRLGEEVQLERLVEALEHLGPRRSRPPARASRRGSRGRRRRRPRAPRAPRGSAAAGGGGSRRGRRRAAAGGRRGGRRGPWETSRRTTSSLKNGLPSVTAREAADEVVRGVGAAAVGDEAPQVVVLEAAEVDAPPEAAQLAEDPLDLRAAARARVVVRGDHEHGDVAERAGEEREQQERRQVGGVEVVEEHDERRASAATRRRNMPTASKRAKRACSDSAGLARLGEAEPVADLGRDLRDPARPGAELRGEAVVGAVGGERAHDLQPRPVGRARRRRPSRAPARRRRRRSAPGRPASAPGGSCRSPARP